MSFFEKLYVKKKKKKKAARPAPSSPCYNITMFTP